MDMKQVFELVKVVAALWMVLNYRISFSIISSMGKLIGEKMGLTGKDTLFPAVASALAFVTGFASWEPTIVSSLGILVWMAMWSIAFAAGVKLLQGWLDS